jgi:hypothetical protein
MKNQAAPTVFQTERFGTNLILLYFSDAQGICKIPRIRKALTRGPAHDLRAEAVLAAKEDERSPKREAVLRIITHLHHWLSIGFCVNKKTPDTITHIRSRPTRNKEENFQIYD